MYCKNCGAQLNDDAKFCTSCGSKIEPKEESKQDFYDEYYDEEPKKETYNPNQSLQEGLSHTDRPTNIYGKQFSASKSGSISFGGSGLPQRRKSAVGIIIGFVVIAIVLFLLFGNSSAVTDVQIGVEVPNSVTLYPDDPIDYVIESEGTLYVSYTATDILGSVITAKVIDQERNDFLVLEETITVDYEEQVGYFEVYYNYQPGTYIIEFYVDDELDAIFEFEVEEDIY